MIVESAQSRSYGIDFGMIARDECCNDNLQTAGTAMVVEYGDMFDAWHQNQNLLLWFLWDDSDTEMNDSYRCHHQLLEV